ncbi:MAG: hypothetical protein RML33_11155 [Acidobacteriota bacterium]|nr:hypothetical protein [Leptospiraceae bacterium]MDW8305378.1 hypothetical protein [Acidobacteriota bacterium]
MKDVLECPLSSLTHWVYSATIDLGQVFANLSYEDFLEYGARLQAKIGKFSVPKGKTLIITTGKYNFHSHKLRENFFYRFLREVKVCFLQNKNRKTVFVSFDAIDEIFLVFDSEDVVEIKIVTLFGSEIEESVLNIVLGGFLADSSIAERVKSVQTNFLRQDSTIEAIKD